MILILTVTRCIFYNGVGHGAGPDHDFSHEWIMSLTPTITDSGLEPDHALDIVYGNDY